MERIVLVLGEMEKLRHNGYLKLTIELSELSRKEGNTGKGRMAILVDTVAGGATGIRSQKSEIPNVPNIPDGSIHQKMV